MIFSVFKFREHYNHISDVTERTDEGEQLGNPKISKPQN